MSADRWLVLSEWHNAWLAARCGERERLEVELGVDYPTSSRVGRPRVVQRRDWQVFSRRLRSLSGVARSQDDSLLGVTRVSVRIASPGCWRAEG